MWRFCLLPFPERDQEWGLLSLMRKCLQPREIDGYWYRNWDLLGSLEQRNGHDVMTNLNTAAV
jgi:hypothetical protein